MLVLNQQQRPAWRNAAGRWLFWFYPSESTARTMIEALKQKLGDEVEKLRIELNVTLPAESARAVEMGDLREHSEHKAAL